MYIHFTFHKLALNTLHFPSDLNAITSPHPFLLLNGQTRTIVESYISLVLFLFSRVESMSMHRNTSSLAPINPSVFEHDLARQVLIPMG